jgi:hypothetical protein
MKLQLQAAIEIDPNRAVFGFTRWVVYAGATMSASTF